MNRLCFLLIALVCISCATHRVQQYGRIDARNKTVTVPPGSARLTGTLKQILANDGWQLVVYSGPTVIEGTVGKTTKLQQYGTFNTRYRLLVSSVQVDVCVDLGPVLTYDVSFIDNQTGTEVFTMNGRGCEWKIIEVFRNSLHASGG